MFWVSCYGLVLPVLQELDFTACPIPRNSKTLVLFPQMCVMSSWADSPWMGPMPSMSEFKPTRR